MRRVLLVCSLIAAALAVSCAPESLDTGEPPDRRNQGGDGGGGAGAGGAGGSATGGSGGTATGGAGGVVIGCDDPEDLCNGGVCPFGPVDCAAAGDRHAALCAAGCMWFPAGMNGCTAAAEMAASCAASSSTSPQNNADWTCTQTAADCAGFEACLLEACQP